MKSSSVLVATAPDFIPSSSLRIPDKINDDSPLDQLSSSSYWDPNGYLLPSNSVQRTNTSFSPAPGSPSRTTSRCIRRPPSKPHTSSFSRYLSTNPNTNGLTSTPNDMSMINSNQSECKSFDEKRFEISNISNDFPLYDPFNSGARLTISTSKLPVNGFDGI